MTTHIAAPALRDSERLAHPKYRADIDGLRAIAVLAVVGFHAFPLQVRGGFIGVDIFFVISGYLISTIIFNNLWHHSFSFSEFYIRRINRIFPALLLVLIGSFTFGWFTLLADEYKQLGKHIAGGAGFISNFFLWNESGYFDNSADTKPLQHLWSLGIEEQFYLVWPLLLWVAYKLRLNLLTIAIVVGGISFSMNIYKVAADTVATFYSPQTRFWELMIGSVLAHMTLRRQNIFAKVKEERRLNPWLSQILHLQTQEDNDRLLRNVQSGLGAALIATAVLVVNSSMEFPGWWAVLPTMGTVLIISAGPNSWLNRIVLSNPILVWFGLISYPLYLWHWPLLTFARIVEAGMAFAWIRIVAVLIAVVFAWLTYRFIEKPIRSGGSRKWKTTILLALMIVVGGAGYSTYKMDGLAFLQSNNPLARGASPFGWHYFHNEICLKRYPFSNNFGHWFCMITRDQNPTLLLFGNSFANQLYPGLANDSNLKHQTVLSIGVCNAEEPANEDEPDFEKNPSYPCATANKLREQNFIDNLIKQSGSIRFVIIDGLTTNPSQKYFLRLKNRIDFLERNHIKVIIFTPHLTFGRDIRVCVARIFHAPENCEMAIEKRTKITDDFAPLIRQLSKTNPLVVYFDQNDLYCDKEKCSAVHNGIPLYRDSGHLSKYGSVLLSKLFVNWARTNIPLILE